MRILNYAKSVFFIGFGLTLLLKALNITRLHLDGKVLEHWYLNTYLPDIELSISVLLILIGLAGMFPKTTFEKSIPYLTTIVLLCHILFPFFLSLKYLQSDVSVSLFSFDYVFKLLSLCAILMFYIHYV